MADTQTHVFRVSLQPKIFRELEIPSTKSLHDLAATINSLFEFDFDHAFGFYSNVKGNIWKSPIRYELFVDMGESDGDARSVKKSRIADAFPKVKDKMTFLFDYGDEWHFRVEVIGLGRKEPGTKYPRLLKSTGAAPPQYPDPDDEDGDLDDE
jgi:hypothetical protein